VGTLDGRVAVITGAGGRLGQASVRAMARAGAAVLAVDVNTETAEAVAQETGGNVRAHTADVSIEDDVKGMVDKAVDVFGGIDILFNNAGLVGLEHETTLLDLDVDLWDRILAVNLRGVMLGCKHVVPHLIARGGGAIINTSSDSSLAGDVVNFAYAASKGGVNVLTRYVAASYGKQNIRCNAISPGVHLTVDEYAKVGKDGFLSELYNQMLEHCLLPRLGTPEDIANLAVFLGSQEAVYITGQLIQVDGGLLSHVPHYADRMRIAGNA
jgi:NAD(P)-dependent dehydrogenase (short-subunit alcohol dehydrogenase family)